MDPMRALASLEFVSARGLDTSDQGPTILANQVMPQQVMDACGHCGESWTQQTIMISLGNGWWSWWRRGASLCWTWRSKGGNGRRSSSFIFTVFIVFFILIIIDIIIIITSVRSQAVLWPSRQRFGRTHVRLMRRTSSWGGHAVCEHDDGNGGSNSWGGHDVYDDDDDDYDVHDAVSWQMTIQSPLRLRRKYSDKYKDALPGPQY